MKLRRLTMLILSAAMTSIGSLHAAEYSAGLTLDADTSYNDNIRLQQNDKTSVKKLDFSPQLTLSAETETDKALLDSTFNFNRYDKSEFNSDDQDVALLLSRQLETGSIGLRAAYVNNSTITSETLTSGRVGNKADRAEQYRLSPNGTYQFDDTNLLQLSGMYATQNYSSTKYIGYKDIEGKLDWIHLLSERTKVIISGLYSDYRSDDTKFNVFVFGPIDESTAASISGRQSYSTRTKSTGAQLGLDYQWSEQSLIKARIGRGRTRTEYPVEDLSHMCTKALYLQLISSPETISNVVCGNLPGTNGTQSTAELEWNWRNERQNVGLNATKSIQPTSNGYAVDAIQIGSNWSYNLSELDVISASLSLVRNHAVDKKNARQNVSIADRNYGSALLQYRRQLNEHWYVDASFRYARQKYIDSDYQASAREYTLGVRYQPQQWYWSR